MAAAHELNSSLFNLLNASTYNYTSRLDLACAYTQDFGHGVLRASKTVNLVASLVFVVVGLVGNALSVRVFCARRMRGSSSNVYLLSLALSDSLYLLTIFLSRSLTTLRCWYFPSTHLDVVNRSWVACKTLQYVADLSSSLSTCLVLALTVERCLAVHVPMRFKQLCTERRARLVCLALLGVIATFTAPHHMAFIDVDPAHAICTIVVETEATFTLMYVLELLLFRVLPVIVIAVLNISIIVRVSKIRNKKRKGAGGAGEEGGEGRAGLLAGSAQQGQQAPQQQGQGVTLMLTVVSTSHVLVCVPLLLHFVLVRLARADLITVSTLGMYVAEAYLRSLHIAGFAINFFLYTLHGSLFRQELYRAVCRRHQ